MISPVGGSGLVGAMRHRSQSRPQPNRTPAFVATVNQMEPFDRPRPSGGVDWNNAGDTVDLREILIKFWARKRIIFAATIISAGLAFLLARLITPIYNSTAYVMIDVQPPDSPLTDRGLQAGVQGGPEAVPTEAFVLQSRALASETIERLHLDRDPEFNPLLRKPNPLLAPLNPVLAWFDGVGTRLRGLLPGTGGAAAPRNEAGPGTQAGNPSIAAKPSTVAVDEFLRRLSVAVQERSNVISVSFSSSRPMTAALVPNTLLRLYLDQRASEKEEVLTREAAWLDRLLPELRGKMRASELALAEYRQKSGLVSERSPTIVSEELSDIRAQLAVAQGEKAEAAARLSQVQGFLASAHQPASRGVTDSPATASESTILQGLREQEVGLQAQLAALRVSLGPNNPKTLQLAAQLANVNKGIRVESAGFVGRLKAELGAADAKEAALNKRLAEYTREYAQANGGDTQLASLIGAADADRKTYEQYLARSNEVHNNIGHAQPDASIVSNAAVPLRPYHPNTKTMVMIGLAIGAGAGIVLAGMMDVLLGGLRSKQQVEEVLGIKCLGLVPRLKRSRNQTPAAELQGAIQGGSPGHPQNTAFGESIRSIQLKLLSFDRDNKGQVVLVTAALPEEGKTWVAASLAASLAAEGFRVALVDCDLHRPAVHRLFGGERGLGLTDYFAGTAGADQIAHNDHGSGIDYIPVGSARSKEAWRITSDRLRPLIDRLRQTYRFIILDSAPVLAASEAAVLSQIAEKTLFVIRWGSTPPQIVRHAMTQLLDSGGPETAVLLSMVDVRRAARYGDIVAGAYKRLESYYGH
jgi:succinoglycan biosynthesis transport protein ExoP